MTCREFADFIADYLAGELPTDQHAVFENHLSLCSECSSYIESYKTTVALVREQQNDEEPHFEHVPEALVVAILDARRAL